MRCGHCDQTTPVGGLVAERGAEVWDETDHSPHWIPTTDTLVLSYVEFVPEPVAKELHLLLKEFHRDEILDAERKYWINHCHHCSARIADSFRNSDAAFFLWGRAWGRSHATPLEIVNLAAGVIICQMPYLRSENWANSDRLDRYHAPVLAIGTRS